MKRIYDKNRNKQTNLGKLIKNNKRSNKEWNIVIPAERHLKIIELISKRGTVQVEELAKILDVSLMTIRRDLEKLRQEGRIDRCHGGAIIKREVSYIEKGS